MDSKHFKKNFSYPTDLVHVASISRMTSAIVFRIRCYVSVITEKYDLSFQLTYHTLAFDFQTANAEEHALFNMSKEQQCRPTYFKYTDYSTTYHRSAHLAKEIFISKAIREYKIQRGTVYRKYPSLAKNRDGECSLMQHHASGASKKWLISPFIPASAAKREKYEIRYTVQTKIQEAEKTSKYSVQAKHFSSEKINSIIKVFPYRTACFGRLTTRSSLAAGQLVVSQTPRGWRLVKCLRCCCRPSRLLVELAAEYTSPWIVSKYTPAPGLLV